MQRSLSLLSLFLTMTLSGCVTMDMPYTMRQKWDGRIGVFTYAEMVNRKGQPETKEPLPDGGTRAKWKMKNTDFNDLKGVYVSVDTMVLTFDRDGILRNWDYYR